MKSRVVVTSVFIAVFTFLVSIISNLKVHAQTETEERSLIVNFSYAQEKIRQNDIWKIYLSVTDPEGNMNRVFFRINRPGGTDAFRKSFIILKKEMSKEFTGYLALYTRQPNELEDFVLELSILDRAGHERKTLLFPIEFDRSAEPMKPLPRDMEKELNRRIGIIDFDWHLQD